MKNVKLKKISVILDDSSEVYKRLVMAKKRLGKSYTAQVEKALKRYFKITQRACV